MFSVISELQVFYFEVVLTQVSISFHLKTWQIKYAKMSRCNLNEVERRNFELVHRTHWWPGVVKGPHGDFEASSFCDQNVLLWDPHILKGDASGVRAPLAHVHLLQADSKHAANIIKLIKY